MGQTIAEKIFSSRLKKPVQSGDIVFSPVDLMMSNDASFTTVWEALKKIPNATVREPKKLVLILDHYCPSPSQEVSRIHQELKSFAEKSGCTLYPEGEGICHQLIPEKGHLLPGQLVIGSDSHTTTYGAWNALATGVGSTDLALAIHYGLLWFLVPPSMKIEIQGNISPGVYAKDIILHIIGRITARGANYQAIEFSGNTLQEISMESRLTICNMAVEMGAKAGIMPGDEICRNWLRERGITNFIAVAPDSDASYVAQHSFDVSYLEPQIACPHQVDNVHPISEVKGEKVGMAFLGTCTNGRLEDLATAAQILKGKKIHPGMILVISPASREVTLEACAKGYIQTLVESGGMLNAPGCGPCVGALGGVPADGTNVISTANRNFLGRMGNTKANIYLSSPATLAASCITGKITDPRVFL
ncbi:MAG: 3-isopropylmalate dehydratase large subunit [Deltaproteobacteria bacterium]|nr:3-isopropylmalate dehydratase large subunit [Deltaproteobacteria bacterium]